MKALSVRAPWWWFILYAGKDIENRSWPTSFRGTVYLHASKWFSAQTIKDEFEYGIAYYEEANGAVINDPLPKATLNTLRERGGHLVGTVEIVDCVSDSKSPWYMGEHGFVLRNPVAFEKPIPCKGALGFFEVNL